MAVLETQPQINKTGFREERWRKKELRRLAGVSLAVTAERPVVLEGDGCHDSGVFGVFGSFSRRLPKHRQSKNKAFSPYKVTPMDSLNLTQIQVSILAEQSKRIPPKKREDIMVELATRLQEALYLNLINNGYPSSLPLTLDKLQVAPSVMSSTSRRESKLTIVSNPEGWGGAKANYSSDDPKVTALACLASEHRLTREALNDSQHAYLDETAVTDPLAIIAQRKGWAMDGEVRCIENGMVKAGIFPFSGNLLDPVVKLYQISGREVEELHAWPVRELGNSPLALAGTV